MTSQHDLAVGMLEGYVDRMIDSECSVIAVNASAGTALLIFRTLGVIDSKEDAHYTERLRRAYERRKGDPNDYCTGQITDRRADC